MLLAAPLVTACSGPQHVLDTAGPHAERIAGLWWLMFGGASIVTLVVAALLFLAIRNGRRRAEPGSPPAGTVNARALIVGGGVVVPLLVVAYLVVETGRVGVAVFRPASAADHLVVDVIGHQYWWEVRYPQLGITTANEIQIPAGAPVRFRISSPDVIHSFWVPRLHGKIDMIPGRTNTIWIEADRAGLFRGQCAEYCGPGHALMAFWVEALDPGAFEEWVESRIAPPQPTDDPRIEFGREVFFTAGCASCHGTRGAPLPASLGAPGPDLADFGRRRTLAAGTRPNNAGTLAAWIVDPETIKPGSRMPGTHLDGERLNALVNYLLSLR
jgi:cytochrome c oxidase subunit II